MFCGPSGRGMKGEHGPQRPPIKVHHPKEIESGRGDGHCRRSWAHVRSWRSRALRDVIFRECLCLCYRKANLRSNVAARRKLFNNYFCLAE